MLVESDRTVCWLGQTVFIAKDPDLLWIGMSKTNSTYEDTTSLARVNNPQYEDEGKKWAI